MIKIQLIQKISINKLSYQIFSDGVLIANGNDYKASDSVFKALRAVRDNIKKDKRVVKGAISWGIKSANGQFVLESVKLTKEGQAEAALTALRDYLADDKNIQYILSLIHI